MRRRKGFWFFVILVNILLYSIIGSFLLASNLRFSNVNSVQVRSNDFLLSSEINETIDEVDNYEKIGSWNDEYGTVKAVFVRDDIAFVGSSFKNSLVILNISNPSLPKLVSTLVHHQGSVRSIYTHGNYTVFTYMYDGEETALVDISNLTNPIHISCFTELVSATDVHMRNNYVYILDRFYGLHIYNISDPFNPQILSTYDFGHEMYGLDVEGDFAYICDESNGFRILNISDPSTPVLIGSSSYWAEDLSVEGSYLYTVQGFGYMRIFDISNKSNPIYISHGFFSGGLDRIFTRNNFAYVLTYLEGLYIFDVSQPLFPQLISTYSNLFCAESVFVVNSYAYVCTIANGLEIIYLGNPNNPKKYGEFDFGTFGEAVNVVVQDDIAFIANSLDGLEILNISDPTNPIQISEYDDGEEIRDVAIKENYAVLACYYEGLKILDITNLSNPTRIAWNDGNGQIKHVYVRDHYVYATNAFSGIEIYDISTITNPTKITTINNFGESVNHVYIENNLLFIANGWRGLQIYNIADPSSPQYIGNYTGYFVLDVVVNYDFAYLACRKNGLVILDISIPSDPFKFVNISLPGEARAVHKSNDFVYITADNRGDIDSPCLYTFNVSCPQLPQLIGKYLDGELAVDVTTSNNCAFLAAREYGLKILDLDSITIPPSNTCPPPPTRPIPTLPSDTTNKISNYLGIITLTTITLFGIYRIRTKIRSKRKNK